MVTEVKKKGTRKEVSVSPAGKKSHYTSSHTPAEGELGEASDFFPSPTCLWGCRRRND